MITDIMWYDALGRRDVLQTRLWAQIALFAIGFSALLVPEIAVADICRFRTILGSGFSAALGSPGGILCFSRALRSMRVVGDPNALAMMNTVADLLRKNGIQVFETFPDDPVYGWFDEWGEDSGCVDWDTEQRIDQVTGHKGINLDSRWWALDRAPGVERSLDHSVCEYLSRHRDLLRARNA